jgi:putative ABC transport system substrate-binding protein
VQYASRSGIFRVEARERLLLKRREFITLLGGTAAAWPLPVRAQQAARLYRIGMLDHTSAALNAANLAGFRQGMRELGYVEGQSFVIEYRSADGRIERYPDLAAELVRLEVDAIVTRGTPAVLAAKNATSTIPIISAALAEPLLVVSSIRRPGGNVTGLSALTSELEAKRLELLREMIPGIVRIAVLYNMANPVFADRWREIQVTARSLGIQAALLDARIADDIPRAFEAAGAQRVEALVLSNDGLMLANRKLIVELAAKHKLPAVYASREFIEAGGLICYAANIPDLYRRAASYVHKILVGANAADLPIEQPTKFELIVNLKAAKLLGLTISESFLLRADEVVE